LLRFITNFTEGNQFKYLEKLVSLKLFKNEINKHFFAALLSRARIEDRSD
jgi:hypothetical protein